MLLKKVLPCLCLYASARLRLEKLPPWLLPASLSSLIYLKEKNECITIFSNGIFEFFKNCKFAQNAENVIEIVPCEIYKNDPRKILPLPIPYRLDVTAP